ncbi:MAG: hypothetical protein QOC80_56 [Frankiaceae bacterium]|nr:hypothetical protein [Frankiaceae bacterium]
MTDIDRYRQRDIIAQLYGVAADAHLLGTESEEQMTFRAARHAQMPSSAGGTSAPRERRSAA